MSNGSSKLEYAKIEQRIPLYADLDDVDPEQDYLHSDVFKDDKLIVDRSTELTEDLLETLRTRGVRKIWIKKATYTWLPLEEALDEKANIVETRKADPMQDHLLRNFGNIRYVETLTEIIEEYESSSIDDMLFSELVSLRSHLPELRSDEERLVEDIKDLDDQNIRLRIIDLLNSRNPDFDPVDYPDHVKGLIKDVGDFLTDLRNFKEELADLLLEIEEENAPELSRGIMEETGFGGEEQVVREGEPLAEPVDFVLDLYGPVAGNQIPLFLEDGFFDSVRSFVENFLLSGHWNSSRARGLIEEMNGLLETVPSLHWCLPKDEAAQDRMLAQAIARLLLYGHLWPESIEGEDREAVLASVLFCDLGMVKIPEKFWLHDNQLEEYQRLEIERHSEHSVDLLQEAQGLPEKALRWVKQHHYRPGKKQETLTVSEEIEEWLPGAQKLALVDVYDSLTSPRKWREPLCPHEVFDRVEEDFEGGESDLLRDFRNKLTVAPPGSFLKLTNDRLAITKRIDRDRGSQVVCLINREGGRITSFEEPVILAEEDFSIDANPGDRVAPWNIRRTYWQKKTDLVP